MNIKEAVSLLELLSDESRLTIIKVLKKNKKMCANDFLPYISCKQATLSHHMSLLVESGLLNSKKKGYKVFYSINSDRYNSLINFLVKGIEQDEYVYEPYNTDIVKEVTKRKKKQKEKEDISVFLL